jgi:hypothetical protein
MLQVDLDMTTILYRGKPVGRFEGDGDQKTITLDALTFTTDTESAVMILGEFGASLRKIEPPRPPTVLSVTTPVADVDETPGAIQLLTEKELKAGGYVWDFHKSDVDPWPSRLHAHEYEHNWKIDAITGEYFDATNHTSQGKLKPKALKDLQQQIWACKDLVELAEGVNLPNAPPPPEEN